MKVARTFSGEFWRGLLLVLALLAFCFFVLSNAKAAEAHEFSHAQRQHRHYHHVHHARHHHRVSHRRWRVKDARKYRAIFEELDSAPRSNILADARRYLGMGNVTNSHRAWCADFVNFILRKTGHVTSGSGMAWSLLHVGRRVSHPEPGDIAVLRGHVTFFAGWGGRGFLGLGGNQGHHRVTLSSYPLSRVVAFVRPR
jgi:uncharacterized protein (TIGR02594 family)